MSARRRRRRNRGSSGNDGGNRSQQGRRRRARGSGDGNGGPQGNRRSRQKPQDEGIVFWGDPEKLPEPRSDVRITEDPAAVPRSLGTPPLPGQEKVAEHYFAVVYDRAVGVAGALAAAGGLIDPGALADDEDEDD